MRITRAMGLLTLLATLGLITAEARQPPPKGKTPKPKVEPAKPAPKAKIDFAALGDVQGEVTVLNVLASLQIHRGQLLRLQTLAPDTMQEAPPRKSVKVSERFRATLLGLRNALVADDEEKIVKLSEEMDRLREKENPEVEDIEITAAARKAAPGLLQILSARQVAGYLGTLAEFPDPTESLLGGIQQSRKLRGPDWQGLRDAIAEEVGWLVAGLDSSAEEKVRERARALLNKAAAIEDKVFVKERPNLEKEVRALVGKVGPTDVIRNYMERVMAEVLSNHRLGAVVKARLAAR